MKLYTVTMEVLRREFEPGKVRVHDFTFDTDVSLDVPTKYALFQNCLKQFGRCRGKIPMGWRFERSEQFDDGSRRWVEYHVTITKGGRPDPGFYLFNEEE